MNTYPLAAARSHLEEALEQAQSQPLLLEDQGKPVAVLLSVGEYDAILEERRKARDRDIARYRAEIEKGLTGPFEELTPEVWAEICEARPEDLDPQSLAVPPGWVPRVS